MKVLTLMIGGLVSPPPDMTRTPPVVISPRSSANYQLELVDGEQVYGLSSLTEKADALAMTWAREVGEALHRSQWGYLLHYRGINIQPLVVNRLFRDFFLDRARVFLYVERILDIERPDTLEIYTSDSVDASFASAVCRVQNVEAILHLPTVGKQMLPVQSLSILLRDIVGPALRNLVPSKSRPPTDKKHIVFLEREVIAGQMLNPAFEILARDPDVTVTDIVFRARAQLPTIVTAQRFKDANDYQSLKTLAHLLNYQFRLLRKALPNLNSLSSVLTQVTPHIIHYLRTRGLPSIVHTQEVVSAIVLTEQPDLLVTVDETGLLGKVVGLVGKKAQVPTLNVQHGIRTDSPWIEDQFFDRFAVFGPQTAEVFVARGADPNSFVPIGVPRYDCLFRKQNLKSRKVVAEELGFNPDRPVLLFASQRAWGRMTPSVKRETLLALLRAWRRTDAELIIKLRDGQDDYIPAEAMKEIGWDRVIVTSEYNLYDLLNAVDIVITAYSTVGLEAIALGKPLFTINLTGQPDPIPFVAEGVAVGSYNPEDVTLKLHYLLDNRLSLQEWERKRTDFIRKFMTNGDGASTERLVHLIYQMLDICR